MNDGLVVLILLIIIVGLSNYFLYIVGYTNEYNEAKMFCENAIGTSFPTHIRGEWDCVDVAGVMHNINELKNRGEYVE